MPRRFGRPGLIGTMARTAVIAGTATAVSGSVARHQQAGAQQAAAAQAAAAPPPPTPPAASPQDDLLAQLARLGQMRDAGLIDDTEFAAAKARLLGL